MAEDGSSFAETVSNQVSGLTRVAFAGTAAEWDHSCSSFTDFTLTQSYAWGQGRTGDGWQVNRDQWLDHRGEPVAMATVLRKRKFGIRLVYISRGPLVFRKGMTEKEAEGRWKQCLESYQRALGWGEVLLCYVYESSARITPIAIRDAGLRPLFAATGEYAFSSFVALTSPDALLQRASSDWRNRFRRSEALLARVKQSCEPEDCLRARRLVARLEARKKFTTTVSESLLRSIAANAHLFYLESDTGEMTAALLVAVAGGRAARLMAGVDPDEARRHPGIARVLEVAFSRWAFEQGILVYDLEGLNPYNRGVFDFKNGLRGSMFSPAGMHACSRPALLAKLYAALKQRRWRTPLDIWRVSKTYFAQLLCLRLSRGRIGWLKMRIYKRDLPAKRPGQGRTGFTLLSLDHFDPLNFEYRLSTVRDIWDQCHDLRRGAKECLALLNEHGYAVGYGFLYWGHAELPEISTVLPLEEQDVYISTCFVIPEYRGRRLYAYLLDQMCAYARRHGARAATIAVNSANRISVRGIESAGFVLEKETTWIRFGGRPKLSWRIHPAEPKVHA